MAYGNYAPFYRGGFFNPMPQSSPIPNLPDNQNQFLQPFQQPMQQVMQQPIQAQTAQAMPMQPQISNEMLWVLNENEAASYPVAPNNNVVLWDKSNPTIYIKSVNAQGVPSMRTLDFVERTENAPKRPETHECTCGDKFVTKEQFEALRADFDRLTAKYEELAGSTAEKTKITVKKSKESEA